MVSFVSSIVLVVVGFVGGAWWAVPVGALFLVDRSWHAQLAYRRSLEVSVADDVLPYATMMCVLQAGLTATAAFGLGRFLGVALAG
jgi:hypothetical protein